MRIAQVPPLYEAVPPRLYGGTERVVAHLTDALVALGHEVTLFASADSITSARLVGCVPTALRLDASFHDPIPYHLLMIDRVRDAAEDFDIIHFHIDQFHFPLFKPMANRTVTTLHGRQARRDVDDAAGAGTDQVGRGRTRHQERAVDVGRDDGLPDLRVGLPEFE